jgi:hypothetical protein
MHATAREPIMVVLVDDYEASVDRASCIDDNAHSADHGSPRM